MAESGRQASLHDGADANGALIAHLEVTTEKRARHDDSSNKFDSGWPGRVDARAVEMRVTVTGIIDGTWFATLNQRIDAGTSAPYYLAYAAGDSYQGDFIVDVLEDVAPGTDWRRCRVVLLSDGSVTYNPG